MRVALLVIASLACAIFARRALPLKTAQKSTKGKAAKKAAASAKEGAPALPSALVEQLMVMNEIVESLKADPAGAKVILHAKNAALAFQATKANPLVKEAEQLEKQRNEELMVDEDFRKVTEEIGSLREAIKTEAEKKKPNEKVLTEKAQRLSHLEKGMLETSKAKEVIAELEAKVQAVREDPDLKASQAKFAEETKAMMETECFKKHAMLLAAKLTKFKMQPKFEDQLAQARQQLANILLEEQKQLLQGGDGATGGQSLLQLDESSSAKPSKRLAALLLSRPAH